MLQHLVEVCFKGLKRCSVEWWVVPGKFCPSKQIQPSLQPLQRIHVLKCGWFCPFEVKMAESEIDTDAKKSLTWAILNEEGNIDYKFAFDEETKTQMLEFLSKNPQSSNVEDFIKCGVSLIPALQSENQYLRHEVERMESKLEQTENDLKEVTKDRDTRLWAEMKAGNNTILEMAKVKQEKQEAEQKNEVLVVKIQSLEAQLAYLKDEPKAKIEEILEVLKNLKITADNINTEVGKIDDIKVNTERAINIVGSEQDRRVKLWTPAAEKMSLQDFKVVVIAGENLFKVAKAYRSLGRDLDRLVRSGKLIKFSITAKGFAFTGDFHQQKSSLGGWGSEAVAVVLVIDGAEDVPERDIGSVACILALALEAKATKASFIVAGPTGTEETANARQKMLEAMKSQDGTLSVLNMTDLAKENKIDINKFDHNGRWSPMAIACLFTNIASWEEECKKDPSTRKIPPFCLECGFEHGQKNCFKDEIVDLKIDEKEQGDIRNKGSSSNGKGINKGCQKCGRNHPPPCRAKDCLKCGDMHYGLCSRNDNRGGGSDFKRQKRDMS